MAPTPERREHRRRRPFEEPIDMKLHGVRIDPSDEPRREVLLDTDRGVVRCYYHPVANARRAAVWVGGAIGGFHSPALGLYPRLARELQATEGIASLQVSFRHSTILEEATMDVLAALAFLEQEGVTGASLTGHSFGGAVMIQAAARAPLARTVVTLATQSFGIDPVATLGPRCPVLLIHGEEDELLPVRCSEYVFSKARWPKELHVVPGGRHALDEVADEVRRLVRDWLIQHLIGATSPSMQHNA